MTKSISGIFKYNLFKIFLHSQIKDKTFSRTYLNPDLFTHNRYYLRFEDGNMCCNLETKELRGFSGKILCSLFAYNNFMLNRLSKLITLTWLLL